MSEYNGIHSASEMLTAPATTTALLLAQSGHRPSRDRLIMANLRLVMRIAGQTQKKFARLGIDFDDVFAAGVDGLIKAIEGFDLSRDSKFCTYAAICIRNATLKIVRRETRWRSRNRFASDAAWSRIEHTAPGWSDHPRAPKTKTPDREKTARRLIRAT